MSEIHSPFQYVIDAITSLNEHTKPDSKIDDDHDETKIRESLEELYNAMDIKTSADTTTPITYKPTHLVCYYGGLVSICRAMYNYPENQTIQSIGCKLLAKLDKNKFCYDRLDLVKTMDVLMRCLQRYPQDSVIVKNSCIVLGHISILPDVQKLWLYMLHRGFPDILQAMRNYPQHKSIQSHCCMFFRNLCIPQEGSEIVGKVTEIVPAVLEILKNFSPTEALFNILVFDTLQSLFTFCGYNRKQAQNLGMLETVVEIMKNNRSKRDIQMKCCSFLYYNAKHCEETASKIANLEGIECACQMMFRFAEVEQAQVFAIQLLGAMSHSTDFQNQIRELGGLALILKAMNNYPCMYVQGACMQTLGYLADNNHMNQDEIGKFAGIPKIIDTIKRSFDCWLGVQSHRNYETVIYGLRALSHCLYMNPENQERLLAIDGAMEILFKIVFDASMHHGSYTDISNMVLIGLVMLMGSTEKTRAQIAEKIVKTGGLHVLFYLLSVASPENNIPIAEVCQVLIRIVKILSETTESSSLTTEISSTTESISEPIVSPSETKSLSSSTKNALVSLGLLFMLEKKREQFKPRPDIMDALYRLYSLF